MGPFGRQAPCVVAGSRPPGALSLTVAALTSCTAGDPDSSGPRRQRRNRPGTALEAAAGALADALASGDFSDVGFTDADPQAVGEEYAATVEGLEDLEPTVTVADVADPSGEQPTAAATFDWTWPIGPDGWTYSSQATFSEADGAVAGRVGRGDHRALAEPSRSPSTWSRWAPSAATSSAPAAWPWSPTGRSCGSASTAARSARARRWRRPATSRGSSTSTPRRTPSGSRPPGRSPSSRRSSTARTRCRAGCSPAYAGSRAARRSRPSCRSRRPRASPRRSSARSAR